MLKSPTTLVGFKNYPYLCIVKQLKHKKNMSKVMLGPGCHNKVSTSGLSLKRFVAIAKRYGYSVEINHYSGSLVGWYPSYVSPYGRMIESRKHFSEQSLKKAFYNYEIL